MHENEATTHEAKNDVEAVPFDQPKMKTNSMISIKWFIVSNKSEHYRVISSEDVSNGHRATSF